MSPGERSRLRAAEFSALEGVAYLDHALRGPLPASSRAAVSAGLDQAARGALGRPGLEAAAERARAGVARLLGWPAEAVAFCANTTAGLAAFAQSLSWRAGDRVVVHADEVPSNVLPWQALAGRGVQLTTLPARASREGRLDPADLARELASGRVRVVSLAAVTLDTGERRDLRALGALARAHGALFCVDAAQALGALALDLSAVDAVCASGRKWLLGPPDVGILALRPGLEADLRAPTAGGLSRDASGAWRAGARRFEGGALPGPLLAGLAASLELLAAVGPEAIEREVLALAEAAAEEGEALGLELRSPRGAARSGVVHLGLPRPAPELEARLAAAGVVARVQGDDLRVSPHFWNVPADLARLFRALRGLAS